MELARDHVPTGDVHHEQLFRTLLIHLTSLVTNRLSKFHPLSIMFHELRELVASVAKAALALALGSSSLFSEYFSKCSGRSMASQRRDSIQPL